MAVLNYLDPLTQQYIPMAGNPPLTEPTGFRNVIRNGDMQIAQRGNGPRNGPGYLVDGYMSSYDYSGSITTSRVPVTDQVLGSDAKYYLSFAVTGQSSATSAFAHIQVPVENGRTLAGKQVTLSFLACSSTGAHKLNIEALQNFGTGGSPSAISSVQAGQFTIDAIAWRRYSTTFTLPSVVGKQFGTNDNSYLSLVLYVSCGSDYPGGGGIGTQNWTFNITDVQLEEGPYATPFERLPVQQQLAWCQRYFQRWQQPPLRGVVGTPGSMATRIGMPLPVPMRVAPTYVVTGAMSVWDGTTTYPIGAPTSVYATTQAVESEGPISGTSTTGRALVLFQNQGAGLYLDLSAEL